MTSFKKDSNYLIDVFRSLMIWRESKNLLEMCEGLVHVVLVVEAEASDEYGIDIGAVLA